MAWNRFFNSLIAFGVLLFAGSTALANEPLSDVANNSENRQAHRIQLGQIRKILFLGNSITLHGPLPSIGWTGNWGMAASSEEKDYVHRFLDHLDKRAGVRPKTHVKNIADFERRLTDYDLKSELKEELAFGADLVIVAVGENASEPKTDDERARFRAAFAKLLTEIKNHGDPAIYVRSQFWKSIEKDGIMRDTCHKAGGTFVDMSTLGGDESNFARSERKFDHAGVAGHPGDRGMEKIADALWESVRLNAIDNDWSGWRGPHATGVLDFGNPPTEWGVSKNVRWSAELPGWGTSSPVVWGNKVYVTSQTESAGKKSLRLLCFDRATGKENWWRDFGMGIDQRVHEKSNLAVNTPALTSDSVYVAFGNSDIACYSHTGELKWVRRYMEQFGDPKMAWGYCISPLLVGDSVIFPWDHHTGPCYLIGLDRKSGEIAWKKDRPIGTAHATPLIVERGDERTLLVPGKHRLTAFDADSHEQLWVYGEGEGPYNGEIISSPTYSDGVVYCQLWRQSAIHALRLNKRGEAPTRLWVSDDPGPVEPSLLLYRERLYAWLDQGIISCRNAQTGVELFRERIGGSSNSSPIASDGRIYLSDNSGKTYVLRAGDTFDLIATNDLEERITASPAILGDNLLYRTDSHLYMIGVTQ